MQYVYALQSIEHHFSESQTTDRAGIIQPMCAIAAQKYGIAHTARLDRGRKSLCDFSANLLQVRSVPHRRHHQIESVRASKGFGQKGHILQIADGCFCALPHEL